MEKLELVKLISAIQDWFSDHNQASKDCKSYLKHHGIDDDIIDTFFVEE